jgi:hypothetical protein
MNEPDVHTGHIQAGKATEFWARSADDYAIDEFWA